MSVEFVDTNVLIYAHDLTAGPKRTAGIHLLTRLFDESAGAASVQVLAEFYDVSTRKLGMEAGKAEEIVNDLGVWTIHRPAHADLIKASRLFRRHGLSWRDAMVVNSAIELGCRVLWTEDLADGRRFGGLTIRNPFRSAGARL
jgi:predicted nucleic acid-binding protein